LLRWLGNFLPFMEPEGTLQCSQEPATGLYNESHEYSPHPDTLFPSGTS